MMSLGDYVMCDFNGNDLGKKYEKLSGVMDRFFVPRKLFNATNFSNKKVHPGMLKKSKESECFYSFWPLVILGILILAVPILQIFSLSQINLFTRNRLFYNNKH